MPEIASGQRYPDSRPWVDISDGLANGWQTIAASRYFKAMADGNTATLNGSVVIGSTRQAGFIPEEFAPSSQLTFTGYARGVGTVEIYVYATGQIFIPSSNWVPELAGAVLIFTYSYQRKAV